jgi:CheY-like chemotaxis protein
MAASIMVIDNDQNILALLDEILTPAGYEVHLYSYGLPDLAELRRIRPALVICDYLADGDDVGADLLTELRHDPDFATLPVIVCSTAHAYLRARGGWWRQPGVSIVSKPFDIDDLFCAVQHALAPPAAIPVVSAVLSDALPVRPLANARSQRAPARALLPHPLPAGRIIWSPGSAGTHAHPDGNG